MKYISYIIGGAIIAAGTVCVVVGQVPAGIALIGVGASMFGVNIHTTNTMNGGSLIK